MQRYHVIDREMSPGDTGFEAMVERAYSIKSKVRCLCRRDRDLDLYIANRQGVYILARWPGTGALHAYFCDHYEAPDFLTGIGQVRGQAVVDDDVTGETLLKFGFPLSRGPARSAPASFTNDKPDVRSTGQKLSIRGFLHYLWDRAQLTHWHPAMQGKRNWFVVRRELVSAALSCKVRGESLGQYLFVPETFKLDDKDAISRRRHGELSVADASRDAIMIMVGEVKSIEKARFGEKMLIKHLPEWPFLIDEDMARRFHKRFAVEEALWQSDDDGGHLVMAASFSIGASGLPQLYELSVMPVTRDWLPYEGLEERALLMKSVASRRRFVKGMRVNLALNKPIASVTFTDTPHEATAVYLTRNLPDPAYDKAMGDLMRTQGVSHMTWRTGDELPFKGLAAQPIATPSGAGSGKAH